MVELSYKYEMILNFYQLRLQGKKLR